MKYKPADVVVVGHICLDVIPTFRPDTGSTENLFAPGALINVGPPVVSTGGAVSNTGLALHRLGIQTRLVSKVGDDLFGRAVLDVLRGYEPTLADGMLVVPGEPTSYSAIISPKDVDRIIFHCPGANDTFHPSEVPIEALLGARILHFGYPPLMRRTYADGGVALAEFFQEVRSRGLFVSVDMARPDPVTEAGQVDWIAWFQRVLPHVDFFAPSIDEILFMLGYQEIDPARKSLDGRLLSEMADTLLQLGTRTVAIKLGEQGLYFRSGSALSSESGDDAGITLDENWKDREILSPCFRVNVKGTTGAGDCTLAGFLSGLLFGQAPEAALRTAVAAGACSVEATDASSGVPHWSVLQNRIDAGWPQLEVGLNLDGWAKSTDLPLWFGPDDRRHDT